MSTTGTVTVWGALLQSLPFESFECGCARDKEGYLIRSCWVMNELIALSGLDSLAGAEKRGNLAWLTTVRQQQRDHLPTTG